MQFLTPEGAGVRMLEAAVARARAIAESERVETLLDIGGGSFEFAAGGDEVPEVAESVPLGAGRMTVGGSGI